MPLLQHTISNVFVLAGLTGSGKTAIVNHFIQTGQQAINLEALCKHDGSVFASLQYPSQPTAYEFHKQLNKVWDSFNQSRTIFIEREINQLGRITFPDWLVQHMNTAPVIWLQTPQALREKRIISFIQNTSTTHLYNCLLKLDKKLGDTNFKLAVGYLQQGNHQQLARILLHYYDNVPGYAYPSDQVVLNLTIDDNIHLAAERILSAVKNLQAGGIVF